MENTVLLQNIFLFRNLGRLDLINVNKLVHAQRYEKGAVIIREGQVPDHMYIVKTGSVYVYIEGAAGKKEVLATLAHGDHFGEMALIDSQPRSANVEAAEDCECLYISTLTSNCTSTRPSCGPCASACAPPTTPLWSTACRPTCSWADAPPSPGSLGFIWTAGMPLAARCVGGLCSVGWRVFYRYAARL